MLKIVLAVALGGYCLYLLALFAIQRSLLFPGTLIQVAAQPPAVPGLEVLRLQIAGANIEALFLPSTQHTPGKQAVMIAAHGNGEVADFTLSAFEGFRQRGIGVLLVEYPGYGRSTGKPSEGLIRQAVDAAYDRIAADPRVDRARIFGFGQSLGGGAICLLSRDRPLRGLILVSTFPSLAIFPVRYGAPAFLLRDRFDNLGAVASFQGPVLVIHGSGDTLIPWQQAQRLAQAARMGTFKLYDCGQGCWQPGHLPLWRDVDPFLSQAGIVAGDHRLP